DNDGLEHEKAATVPSNSKEVVNLNSDEGAGGIGFNFPRFPVQDISGEIGASDPE
ncbi:hypothetical protein MKW98_009855, partial [Papaver atlanticum]